MAADQKISFPIEKEVSKRREFSDREVGITHPDLASFIRLNDQGDIEIFAAPGVGLVISARSKSISLFGDTIRLFSREDGLRWNNYSFNYSASSYIEPTLVKINPKSIHTAINGMQHFLSQIPTITEEQLNENVVTITPNYSFGDKPVVPPSQDYSSIDNLDGLSMEQVALVEAYSTTFSSEHMAYVVRLLKEGYEFQQAHQKALRDIKNE